MKDKVKEFLENEEEKSLWEKVYNAFQEGGREGLEKLIKDKIQLITKEFEEKEKKIKEILELGGGYEDKKIDS